MKLWTKTKEEIMRKQKIISLLASSAILINLGAVGNVSALQVKTNEQNVYKNRFLSLYQDLKNKDNGYFSPQGVPYHSVETLMCEAPDQGHESTSEAASYYVWLEAMNSKFTGDFKGLTNAWDTIEKYYIPTDEDQPGQDKYNPKSPATYASEYGDPAMYPSELKFQTKVGNDPLYNELKSTYNTSKVYGMHWLIDGDNFYGYGQRGDGKTAPCYINTFQRGEQESTWETVPQPSWEDFSYGGKNGFLDLFTKDASYSKQWRYTNAPDADARTIQAMYSAEKWANEDGVNIDPLVSKASKMGDYLRYSLFDKYFMKIGTQNMEPGQDRNSMHGLMSWYYAWGGALPSVGDWSWRIGCSHSHFGYQNPMAAYALSNDSKMTPKSPTAKDDWKNSLDRQIEFYTWLQSSEGAIAGGCSNSYNGAYEKLPADVSTFYGMGYQENPVYHDPGSNRWFGMQTWSMQRVAEYYLNSGDPRVKPLLDKWVNWATSVVHFFPDGTFEIPNNLIWKGQPDTWTGKSTGNPNLHVSVEDYGTDLGVTGSFANTLITYAAAIKKNSPTQDYSVSLNTAKELLDRTWNLYRDSKGLAVPEARSDYSRFFTKDVYLPHSVNMANGGIVEPVNNRVSFIDLRKQYYDDPMMKTVTDAINKGEAPVFTYHRFWAQCEQAIASGTLSLYFPELGVDSSKVNVSLITPTANSTFDMSEQVTPITLKADASVSEGSLKAVKFYADDKLVATKESAPYTAEFIPTDEGRQADGTKVIKLTAKAVTNLGKEVTSQAVPISVKFAPCDIPKVLITSPKANETIDASGGLKSFKVYATASIKKGDISKIEIFADGVSIGTSVNKDSCEAVFHIPDEYGEEPDYIKKVDFTAVATSDLGIKGNSDVYVVKIKLPIKPPLVTSDIGVSVNYNGNENTTSISNTYTLKNNGDNSYDLNKLKIKYYIDKDSYNNFNSACDNAGMHLNAAPYYISLTSKVKINVVDISDKLSRADAVVEITFPSTEVKLSKGAEFSIGTRLYTQNWNMLNQSNDYSYGNANKVVVEYDGQILHGEDIK